MAPAACSPLALCAGLGRLAMPRGRSHPVEQHQGLEMNSED